MRNNELRLPFTRARSYSSRGKRGTTQIDGIWEAKQDKRSCVFFKSLLPYRLFSRVDTVEDFQGAVSLDDLSFELKAGFAAAVAAAGCTRQPIHQHRQIAQFISFLYHIFT